MAAVVSHASSDDFEFYSSTSGELANMARMKFLALGAAILPSALALPSNVPENLATNARRERQYSAPTNRAQAVVDTFKLSWEGYYKYAFPNDELLPVNNSFSNSR
jgi:mannosyl-oligosaccharide alpha-1,2-mannosidase